MTMLFAILAVIVFLAIVAAMFAITNLRAANSRLAEKLRAEQHRAESLFRQIRTHRAHEAELERTIQGMKRPHEFS
ncbi:hypothetical protein Poly21_01560 [Allorhodopirellula heiligendammensis]|uniref:Uncharacterized protein n=1 Tax=Allorhodopirellula heiligendammensis TaxID=2714739 RepID=A0A5C6C0C7_9BACT|nr:hypothetical protein Poly21_01560 [Allorhodopirellula heiligendammensis]